MLLVSLEPIFVSSMHSFSFTYISVSSNEKKEKQIKKIPQSHIPIKN
jgi:hypothetical protein